MTASQLKASILDLAIRGKLVAQDPADEPAEKLLERIRKEKPKDGGERRKKPDCLPITDEEKPFDLPAGWTWVRLGEMVFNHGQKQPCEKFCYIDIGSIDNAHQRLNASETILEPKQASSRARKIVHRNDVIYSCVRPYLHNVAIIDRDFSLEPIASTGFAVMATRDDTLLNKYLFYYLLSPTFDDYANDGSNAKGIAYPAISDSRLYAALLPLPPLGEQKRIVAKVEELLPMVEEYGAAFERRRKMVGELPEKLRKSILQRAIEGKLVAQDPDDEPASKLLAKIAAEKARLQKGGKAKKEKPLPPIAEDEKPFPLPPGWEWVRLGDVIDIASNLVQPEQYKHFPHIAPDNIEKGTGKLLAVHTVSEDMVLSPNHLFRKGQLLYSKIRPLLRKTIIAPYEGLCCADMYPINSELYIPFLQMYLLSDFYNNQVSEVCASRVKMPKINQKEMLGLVLALPPLAEQERIVAKVRELLVDVEQLKI